LSFLDERMPLVYDIARLIEDGAAGTAATRNAVDNGDRRGVEAIAAELTPFPDVRPREEGRSR
jgi:hypothetical protein